MTSPMMLRAISHQSAAADALDGAEGDELGQVLAQTAQRRPGQEDEDGDLEDGAPAVEVGDLAPERGGGGGGEQVGGDDPGQLVEAAQLADDARQGGADDALVEGGQQNSSHEPDQDDDDFAMGEILGFVDAGIRRGVG